MSAEDFENLLLLWGYAFGPHSSSGQLSYFGDSAIAAFGQTRSSTAHTAAMDRGGVSRRRLMGAAAGLVGRDGNPLLVPTWAAQPVRGTTTRTATAKLLGVGAQEFSPEVMRVEVAAMQLHRLDDLLGSVLRAEYCSLGGQDEKSRRFNLRRGAYRERVAEARGWMRCRLAA